MKKYGMMAATFVLAGLASATVYAGTWEQNTQGWWYNNGDGTWPASTWQWIDGNGDGNAECYYFDANGYCLMNRMAPDGYSVNADGAWTVNGTVQTKKVGITITNNTSTQQAKQSNVSYDTVVKAYKAYMLKKDTNKYNPIRYAIVYLDGDDIPELMYATGSYHATGVKICTYQNGKVCPLSNGDQFGGYGAIAYYPRTGYFEADDNHMGYSWDCLYLQQGANVQVVCYINYNNDQEDPSYTTEYDKFQINGADTTKANAESYMKQLVGVLTSSVFRYDEATKLK